MTPTVPPARTRRARDAKQEARLSTFAERVIAWQRRYGRHDLPWQQTRDAYRIWLSEIMLQQTQVAAVIPYYARFLARFPDVKALASATEDEVLALWSGLGYYARGRNLHRAARTIETSWAGAFPRNVEAVCALPGVGPSTAAAICVFAYGARHAILDGNVKRVFARHFGIAGYPGEKRVQDRLWRQADAVLPEREIEPYTQGLMDLGATVCVRRGPLCRACPVSETCVARRDGTTRRLPSPRPAKLLPQRETTMLVLVNAGEVLLEKRPVPGIWGGLWSFPESTLAEAASMIERVGDLTKQPEKLTPIEHGFTHFRLRIHPLVAHVQRRRCALEEPGRLWLTPEEAKGAAIPVPVRKILEVLTSDVQEIKTRAEDRGPRAQ